MSSRMSLGISLVPRWHPQTSSRTPARKARNSRRDFHSDLRHDGSRCGPEAASGDALPTSCFCDAATSRQVAGGSTGFWIPSYPESPYTSYFCHFLGSNSLRRQSRRPACAQVPDSHARLELAGRAFTSIARTAASTGPRISIPNTRPGSASSVYVARVRLIAKFLEPPGARHRLQVALLLRPGQDRRRLIVKSHSRLHMPHLDVILDLNQCRAILGVALQGRHRDHATLPVGRRQHVLHRSPDLSSRGVDLRTGIAAHVCHDGQATRLRRANESWVPASV